MLQPNHGDSNEMIQYVKKCRSKSLKFLGHYSKINNYTYMYTNYGYQNEWALIIHGIGGSAKKMSPYAEHFLNLKYNTIIIGSYRNTIDFINNWENDIIETLNILRTKYNIIPKIIYGQSLGASATLSIVASKQFNFKYAIVDSPFDDFFTTATHMYPIGAKLLKPILSNMNYPKDILSKVKTIDIPILYCFGTNDTVTTPEQVTKLIKATKNKAYIKINNAGHCRAMYYNTSAYWKKIADFINQ